MAYTKVNWVDGVTPENSANLGHMDDGILAADTAAAAAAAALPGKENKSEKGAISGYAPLDAGQKVPLANLPPMGADLSFDGDWVPATYQDGDTVVKDGVVFMCVGGPTSVAPDPTLWGAPSIPTVVNGKWIRGSGGAMVWTDIATTRIATISAANTDLAAPQAGSQMERIDVTTTGGTLRSIGAGVTNGQEVTLFNDGASSFTIRHNLAGGTGAKLFCRGQVDLILGQYESATFWYSGTTWVEMSRDVAPPAWVAYTPALKADAVDPVIGNGAANGRYNLNGKSLIADLRILFGSTSTYGSGRWKINFPVAAANILGNRQVGSGFVYDNSASLTRQITAQAIDATQFYMFVEGGDRLTEAAPYAWAVNDQINLILNYEAA